jgi:hypothetical protein
MAIDDSDARPFLNPVYPASPEPRATNCAAWPKVSSSLTSVNAVTSEMRELPATSEQTSIASSDIVRSAIPTTYGKIGLSKIGVSRTEAECWKTKTFSEPAQCVDLASRGPGRLKFLPRDTYCQPIPIQPCLRRAKTRGSFDHEARPGAGFGGSSQTEGSRQ